MTRFVQQDKKALRGFAKKLSLTTTPAHLREVFGELLPGDGYKVDGEYCFLDTEYDIMYLVYAFMGTSLCGSKNPTPEEFWKQTTPFEFSVAQESFLLAWDMSPEEKLDSKDRASWSLCDFSVWLTSKVTPEVILP